MRPMNFERGEGPQPMQYDAKRYARYRTALDVFQHPDTDTQYGHPTREELERAYAGELDQHPNFERPLADTTQWCAAMSGGRGHGGAL